MSLPLGTPASPLQQKTVLIIEDDPELQQELTTALASAGYRVRNAYDGQAGLRIILEEAPDLVVLDLILPKKDGFKVLREMKWREGTKNIPVIVVSNLENTENIELAIRLGAKSYLVKANYPVDNIVGKIQGVLEEYIGNKC
jgi:DNA-binding response OmpR family regulator